MFYCKGGQILKATTVMHIIYVFTYVHVVTKLFGLLLQCVKAWDKAISYYNIIIVL